MLFGRLPFKALTMDELKQEIRSKSGKNLQFPPNILVSEESKSLLKEMLEFDPITRISWKKFFNHPLFDKYKEFAPAKSIVSSQIGSPGMNASGVNQSNMIPHQQHYAPPPVSFIQPHIQAQVMQAHAAQ